MRSKEYEHPQSTTRRLRPVPAGFAHASSPARRPPASSQTQPAAHDSFNRLVDPLATRPRNPLAEAQPQLHADDGILVLDDSTLDKPYARHMDLVGWHWSGKHHRAVKGINLLTLLWTDGDRHVPCDYRLYDKAHDGHSKNDLFGQLLRAAKQRGLQPKCICFDSWYSSLDNLKLIRSLQWHWLTPAEGQPQSAGGFRLGSSGEYGGHSRARTDRSSAGLWLDSCVPGSGHKRRHGPLGEQRSGHGCLDPAEIWGFFLADRGISSRHQAVLWGGTVPGSPSQGAA